MNSCGACCFAAIAIILTQSMIFQATGQPTAHGSDNGDSSISIVEQIQLLKIELFGELKQQAQGFHELLSASFQQIRGEQDSAMTSLQAVNRRSQEQDINIRQLQSILNASFQQVKIKQDSAMATLQAVDRRSQEQDINIRQVQSILNASFQQVKIKQDSAMATLQAVDRRSQEQDRYIKQVQSISDFLTPSFQQLKTQHDSAMRSLEAINRRLDDHRISTTNQTQNSWKLAVALGIDLEAGHVLPPILNNWIVLLHRYDRSVTFDRNWAEYKNGFGNTGRGEFWLGNEKIHRLTNKFAYTLRIEVFISGKWYCAEYSTFTIDSESNKYTLRISGYSGNAGDSMTSGDLSGSVNLDGMAFSTSERDNDRYKDGSCSNQRGGAGWWFNYCEYACLTGNTFRWYSLRHVTSTAQLQAARMMIKSR